MHISPRGSDCEDNRNDRYTGSAIELPEHARALTLAIAEYLGVALIRCEFKSSCRNFLCYHSDTPRVQMISIPETRDRPG